MTDCTATLALATPDETTALGRRLAPQLRPGDTLLLDGPIGAGKSHFARAVIDARLRAMGRREDIPSPTYTLVQTYEAGDVTLIHADLYRLAGPDDAAELGLEDAWDAAICLIEWPDRLGSDAPAGALHLRLSLRPDGGRDAQLTGPADRWRAVLSDLTTAGAVDA
ncbi:tRNA (adenosine(37)-N6)-threonylcarbamoyltransferase complex ATPase subunit type 1 TsaE [Rhodobacteraceae bacterium CCMM004]|nr:tRNA (adenosine(37)-N6)-threonylcarbamoyltransferase complex ATPase subunit type 1 TsaE [Rhodobacteraceae bacterium CCMM004]